MHENICVKLKNFLKLFLKHTKNNNVCICILHLFEHFVIIFYFIILDYFMIFYYGTTSVMNRIKYYIKSTIHTI